MPLLNHTILRVQQIKYFKNGENKNKYFYKDHNFSRSKKDQFKVSYYSIQFLYHIFLFLENYNN